jgi:RHS repeat-associated protein
MILRRAASRATPPAAVGLYWCGIGRRGGGADVGRVELPHESIAEQLARLFRPRSSTDASPTLHLFTRSANEKLASGPLTLRDENNVSEIRKIGSKSQWGVENGALPFADPATGLIYARARWLDPSTGTFLSADPAGYRDSSNLYAYCAGDPVNCKDPTGLQAVEERDVVEEAEAERVEWEHFVRLARRPMRPTARVYAEGSEPGFESGETTPFFMLSPGQRMLGGKTADAMTPAEQEKFLAHRRRLRTDPAYRAWWQRATHTQVPMLPGRDGLQSTDPGEPGVGWPAHGLSQRGDQRAADDFTRTGSGRDDNTGDQESRWLRSAIDCCDPVLPAESRLCARNGSASGVAARGANR